MQIGVLGINHKSAPLKLREQVAQVCCGCKEPDKVILSTCNRTEIYFSGENLAEMQCQVFAELKKRLNHSSEHAFYSFFGAECFYHLACVTTGIDSKVLAESDIQRQVKVAYEIARNRGELSNALHYLFQKSLKVAKDARSRFSLFQSTIHLEGMVYQIVDSVLYSDRSENVNLEDAKVPGLADLKSINISNMDRLKIGQSRELSLSSKSHFQSGRSIEKNPTLLFVGNSEINRKIIHYFYRRKKGRMTLISRDLETAHPFALDYGLTLKSRDELANACQYEGIISATTAPDYLLSTLAGEKQTRLILDLSVPRSVHPNLNEDPSLTLLNMEQVGELFTQAHTTRHIEVEQIRSFLETSVHAYTERFLLKTALGPVTK